MKVPLIKISAKEAAPGYCLVGDGDVVHTSFKCSALTGGKSCASTHHINRRNACTEHGLTLQFFRSKEYYQLLWAALGDNEITQNNEVARWVRTAGPIVRTVSGNDSGGAGGYYNRGARCRITGYYGPEPTTIGEGCDKNCAMNSKSDCDDDSVKDWYAPDKVSNN